MEKRSVAQMRRLKINSQWTAIAAFTVGTALLMAIQMIKNLAFPPFLLFIMLFLLALGGPFAVRCLQKVVITNDEVQVKLGWIVLQRIPVSEIRTIVYLTCSIGRGESLKEHLIVLSRKSAEHIQRHGDAIICSDPQLRTQLLSQGLELNDAAVRTKMYFLNRIRFGFIKKEEGLWISSSPKNVEIIEKIFSCVECLATYI